MAHLVGAKGQVVIAKEIRDRLGIAPGWVALQRLSGNHVEVYFVPPPHKKSLRGALAKYTKVRIPPGKEWRDAKEEAWKAAAKDKMGTGKQA